jgi:hypothetical protein
MRELPGAAWIVADDERARTGDISQPVVDALKYPLAAGEALRTLLDAVPVIRSCVYPAAPGKHPGSPDAADAHLAVGTPDNGGISVAGQRDGPTLFDVLAGSDQPVALLCPTDHFRTRRKRTSRLLLIYINKS